MKNKEYWRPTKFVYLRKKLIASRDPKEVSVSSRLVADQVALFYDLHLKNHVAGRLIDLGCGTVPLYASYKDYATECICVDWSNTSHPNQFLDHECDLNEPLPFEKESFRTIILSDVLEHLREPGKVWKEMSRILETGGRVILNVPFYYKLHEIPFDYFRYTEYALRYFAESSGFRILLIEPLGGVPEILADLIAKNITRLPWVGNSIAAFTQATCSLFIRTGAGSRLSAKTAKTFPLGYFMIAEKV